MSIDETAFARTVDGLPLANQQIARGFIQTYLDFAKSERESSIPSNRADINNWLSDAPASRRRSSAEITQTLMKGLQPMTFEEYLIQNSHPNKKTPDHALRVRMTDAGVTFYIHPQGEDGDTVDFLVKGNTLLPDPNVTKTA